MVMGMIANPIGIVGGIFLIGLGVLKLAIVLHSLKLALTISSVQESCQAQSVIEYANNYQFKKPISLKRFNLRFLYMGLYFVTCLWAIAGGIALVILCK
jgi:hypothetical protein